MPEKYIVGVLVWKRMLGEKCEKEDMLRRLTEKELGRAKAICCMYVYKFKLYVWMYVGMYVCTHVCTVWMYVCI